MMPADQAAKVLRRHNEWRRGADSNHWQQPPYSPAELGHAIDAAVAALDVAASAVPVAWLYTMPISGERIASASRKMLPNEQPLFSGPQPAYCCAKCGLAETKRSET